MAGAGDQMSNREARKTDRAPVLVVQGHVAKFALVRGPARHPPQTWSLKARRRGRAQEMLQERLPQIPVISSGRSG